ncbi:unnamed protein product, partial [Urochloa humidicola]
GGGARASVLVAAAGPHQPNAPPRRRLRVSFLHTDHNSPSPALQSHHPYRLVLSVPEGHLRSAAALMDHLSSVRTAGVSTFRALLYDGGALPSV